MSSPTQSPSPPQSQPPPSPTQPQPHPHPQDSPPQPQPEPEPEPATVSPPPPPPPQEPPQPPPIIQALSYSPLKKPQPIPWSHEETLNLIKAYQEKWYSLKRGQLKASQWEEVAVTIAARCGLDEPSKSGTQCRHKIEKLRKRYRAEKTKLPPNYHYNHTHYHHHPWIYYSLMDQLERGPMPISAVAPTKNEGSTHHHDDRSGEYDDDDEEEEEEDEVRFASLRQLKGERSPNFRDSGKRDDGFGLRTRLGNGFGKRSDFDRKRKDFYGGEEQQDGGGGGDDEGKRSGLLGELAAEIRGFAEKFVRVEKKKMDLMRENERFRNEMENKRMEMIYVSQQTTVDLINKAFDLAAASNSSSHKKMKMNSDL